MQPRTDISGQLTAALLGQVGHADWKARQTALTQVEGIVERAQRRIAPTVGPLLAACRARLADSNKNMPRRRPRPYLYSISISISKEHFYIYMYIYIYVHMCVCIEGNRMIGSQCVAPPVCL